MNYTTSFVRSLCSQNVLYNELKKGGVKVIEGIEGDFPFLKRGIVYLDNAATSQRPSSVIEAISEFYSIHNANIHRGIHTLSMEATEMYEDSRKNVASFLNSKPEEIIFTYGTTSSINFLSRSLIDSGILKENDVVLLTRVEHHSNLVPWQRLKRFGVKLKFVESDEDGVVNEEDIIRNLDGVKIVSMTGLSNVTGQLFDIEKVVYEAKRRGVLVHVDGAQLIPHTPIDLSKIEIDFLSFSGHKMLGPTGIGVLYVSENHLNRLEPFLFGGGMIDRVELEDSTFADPPEKFEAGTPNVAGAIGLSKAVDYLKKLGMERVHEHSKDLTAYALERMKELDFVKIFGPKDERHVSIVSFTIDGIHPHDIAHILDEEFKIAVRSGHHCAQPLMRRLGVNATTRASFYVYNKREDVDLLIEGLKKVREWIG